MLSFQREKIGLYWLNTLMETLKVNFIQKLFLTMMSHIKKTFKTMIMMKEDAEKYSKEALVNLQTL